MERGNVTSNRRVRRRRPRSVRPITWAAAVVVPVVAGGLAGGRLGGVVAALIVVPWFEQLVRDDASPN
jgi:hypothetical protein